MFKINKKVNNEVKMIQINKLAKRLTLYDERFPYESQGGGYKRFVELCLNTEDLTTCCLANFHVMLRGHVAEHIEFFRSGKKLKEDENKNS